MRAPSRQFTGLAEEPKRGVLVPALVALLVVGGVVWGGSRLFRGHTKPAQTAGTAAPETAGPSADTPAVPPDAPVPAPTAQATPPTSAAPSAPAPGVPTSSRKSARVGTTPPPNGAAASHGQSSAAGGSNVVHQEIPTASPSARATIHGHVKVGVRVTVDKSGRVVHESLDNPGPSRYFNRLASEAARKWRFAAADDRGTREWLLRFEFGRDGTTVHAVGPRS